MLTDWVLAIEGTEAGRTAAMVLALVSAVAHASFGAIQKGRHDPWMTRAAVDVCYLAVALPIAVFLLPWPEPALWPILAGVFVIHALYKWLMAMAYSRGAYSAVYPVVRGTGPLGTVAFAWVVFGETYAPGQWLGIALLSGGILALAAANVAAMEQVGRRTLRHALWIAFATGLVTAGYTTYDAYGIRLAQDPFVFLAWFFVVDGLLFPILGVVWYRRMAEPPALGPLMLRGALGAMTALLSFGAVMLATRLDKVGEAAALRETSVVFAALIGWIFLGERIGPVRAGLMVVIGLGAVLVEFG
ncbi:MAG: DMT family transporter [Pseudomonadota bacterium]